MNHYVTHRGAPPQQPRRAVLLFAGWSMDAAPFRQLALTGHDILTVCDYRSLDFSPLVETLRQEGYCEIVVVGWSFGAIAAARFIDAFQGSLPITRCIAVNATLYPSHPDLGIPPHIFQGTLDGLSPRSLTKFQRRMCGSSEAWARFSATLPSRPIEELAEELRAIGERDIYASAPFDVAYVSLDDAIIPAAAQSACWRLHDVDTVELPGPHLPDFASLLSREVVVKQRVEQSFSAALPTYDNRATVQHLAARRLLSLWQEFAPLPAEGEIMEFGVGSGYYTSLLRQALSPSVTLRLWDLAPSSGQVEQRDAETEIASLPRHGLRALTSASTVQWFNSLPRFLERCVHTLSPHGVCAFSTFGPLTYRELAPYQNSRPHYLDPKRLNSVLGSLQRRGLIESYRVEAETMVLDFLTPRDLIDHLKQSGVNATQAPDVRSALAMVRASLTRLTYQPIYILLRLP